MAELLTIAKLISDPALDTKVIAGQSGLGRIVRWAQTSESAEPWRWLGNEELLMSLGLNIPAEAQEQADFVRKADAAGIAGLIIGQDGLAPELTREMLQAADELTFPVLSTGPQTPFVVIARTVAAVTTNQLNRSVLLLSRMYQEAGSQNRKGKRSGDWVEKLCSVDIAVQDTMTGCPVIGTLPTNAHRRHSLSTIRPTQLLVPADAQLDALLLVHLKQILAVDANSLLQDAGNAVAAAETSLRLGLAGKLGEHDIDGGAWIAGEPGFRVACAPGKLLDAVAMSLSLHGLMPLATSWKNNSIAVVREKDLPVLRTIASELQATFGLSSPQQRFADLEGAAQEAQGAIPSEPRPGELVEFSGLQVSLLARSASEAERIVSMVLGPLAGSSNQVAVYRDSLFALLDRDLQWQHTANFLGIHRQTLAYRIKQAELLTGRSVRKVVDISDFYLARKAWPITQTGSARTNYSG
ncbi:PucR family transcriptional regulator [Glutamicibacter sp. NPDC087831]|uniref:PucR family transcriptional regulator n=1 Tax=unclassified Glutamicibacter TaxID=2627139 RepID=UPI0037F3BFB0